jgi:predicted Zn-dependent protease with MMP-like domain
MMRKALAELPDEYVRRLDNVEFVVSRALLPRDRRRLGAGVGTLYGLYEGTPLTQRDSHYGNVAPDKITLYWGPLVRDFPDEAALAEQVRITLLHEIGHYFGLAESDLHDTSVR